MTTLDQFIPKPRLTQIDEVEVGAPAARAFERARCFDIAGSPLARALFTLRAVPDRLTGKATAPPTIRLDEIPRTPNPGFMVLDEQPGRSFVIGAIGRFWEPDITFREVPFDQFASFVEPGWGKVAWELRCEPRGAEATRIVLELRVDASWRRQQRYFALIGPFSHLLRRHMLGMLERELGSLDRAEGERTLPGDELIGDAKAVVTHTIDIAAPPAAIWPWLVQMGRGRAGWYSWDLLDNGGTPSAQELHAEWQSIAVGDVLPTGEAPDVGFFVLRVDAPSTLVLGGTIDLETKRSRPIGSPRPPSYWESTWTFHLEPLDAATTRLHVRARVSFEPRKVGLLAEAVRHVHAFMERKQLRELKLRVERACARRPGYAEDREWDAP